MLLIALIASSAAAQTWRFAVAGDSRNCGDIVMPAIADGARTDGALFYWHLGDFRALSHADEDMEYEARTSLSPADYKSKAWPDFVEHQVRPFAQLPVFLAIGNHELHGRTRSEVVKQFAPWLTGPRTYYHWIERGVDFITLDNASPDMFDEAQVTWLRSILARDASDSSVKTVVLGMHEALPHSLACDHSMNESPTGESTGSRVYRDLLAFRSTSHKNVFIIASHAHFWMRDVYDTPYWRAHGGVLPGIIAGTAGAVRYRLPDTAQDFSSDRARTDTYGYVLGTVQPDGTITFAYREIARAAIPPAVVGRYTKDGVDWCFSENRNDKPHVSAPCSAAK